MMLAKKEKTVNKVILISIESVVTNPSQPRSYFSEENLQILASSIEQNGLLQPITVRKNFKGEYELISGERRLRACKLLGYNYIDAIVVEKTSEESAVLALIENIHREDLNIFEQANALKLLILNWKVTQEEAANRLAMTQSTIANKLRILKLSDAEQELILKEGLTERHARALLKVKEDEKRMKILLEVIKMKLNVQETEKFIEDYDQHHLQKSKAKNRINIKNIKIFTNTINKAVKIMKESGINVSVKKKEQSEFVEYLVRIPIASEPKV